MLNKTCPFRFIPVGDGHTKTCRKDCALYVGPPYEACCLKVQQQDLGCLAESVADNLGRLTDALKNIAAIMLRSK